MLVPTPSEASAIKADAQKRFGSLRALSCPLTSPIDACVVLAPFDLVSYTAHVDARAGNVLTAQAGAVIDRLLWCSPSSSTEPTVDALVATKDDPLPLRRVALARLELLSRAWPAASAKLEIQLRETAGRKPGAGVVHAHPLTAGNAPSGLSPAAAQALLDAAPRAGVGSLWSVSEPGGMALVLRAPQPEVYLAARAAFGRAHAENVGIVDSTLVLARQLVVWSPAPLDAYLDEHPGYAEDLWNPLWEMGGSAATCQSSFL